MTWKMVPVEPSTDSRWAGAKKKNAYRLVGGRKANPYEIYQAMLAAAPKYEPTDEQVEAGARALCRLGKPRGHTCAQACPWQEDGDEYYCSHATETHGGRARAVLMTLEG